MYCLQTMYDICRSSRLHLFECLAQSSMLPHQLLLQLLLGYLPPDPAEWEGVLKQRRAQYQRFCEVTTRRNLSCTDDSDFKLDCMTMYTCMKGNHVSVSWNITLKPDPCPATRFDTSPSMSPYVQRTGANDRAVQLCPFLDSFLPRFRLAGAHH